MCRAMQSWVLFATAAVISGILAACHPLLAPDDRKDASRVAVEENFGSPVFHANVLSGPAGGLAGAGGGALWGLMYGLGPQALVTVPIGALVGVVQAGVCQAAGQNHPTADADFERFLIAADAGVLKRTLEADLNGPRAQCGQGRTDDSATVSPETIIAIEKIIFEMGCAFGQQQYQMAVQWRTLNAHTRNVLHSTTTTCRLRSFRSVDDWFANPGQATAEIERVLTRTGRQMAALLVSESLAYGCSLRSLETGEVTAR